MGQALQITVITRFRRARTKFDRMDPADASLVVLSEIHRDARIITTDRRDFSVYRRFGRQRLPLVLPPE